MLPHWIFEKDAYDDGNTARMLALCAARGIPATLTDFGSSAADARLPTLAPADIPVVLYGSIGFIRHAQRELPWHPAAWADWHALRCSTYLAHWGRFAVQQDYALLPLAEVHRLWHTLFERFDPADALFIKPDEGDKRFHGQLVVPPDRDNWHRLATFYGAPPETLALVSRPAALAAEWRFVVAQRTPITGARYTPHTANPSDESARPLEPGDTTDAAATAFARSVATSTGWQPAPIYTLDVCQLSSGEFRLMEIGSVNCSSLYACDLAAVIDAATSAASR